MLVKRRCKGCYPVLKLPAADIYDILEEKFKLNKNKIISKEKYGQRIKACEKCADLLGHSTCRYSGALIYITAGNKKEKCYHPVYSKW